VRHRFVWEILCHRPYWFGFGECAVGLCKFKFKNSNSSNVYCRVCHDITPKSTAICEDSSWSFSDPAPCEFMMQRGNCVGYDVYSWHFVSLEFCKMECSLRLDCVSFHYNIGRRCFLKRHNCSEKELKYTNQPTANQYSKPGDCLPRFGKLPNSDTYRVISGTTLQTSTSPWVTNLRSYHNA
jgi:hypothetical protein